MAPVVGIEYLLETRGLRSVIQELQKEVDTKGRKVKRILGNEMVQVAKNERNRSLMNRDTGLMRRSYKFNVRPHSTRIDIYNKARSPQGFPYPKVIERRYKAFERTVRNKRGRIVDYTKLEMRRPERRGLYRNELVRTPR